MGLNDIKLPASLIADLYKSSLIETKETINGLQTKEVLTEKDISPAHKGITALGNNQKNILIVVDYNDAVHLPDAELNFLTGILGACKLSVGDVAIVNYKKHQSSTYKDITDHFKSKMHKVDEMRFAIGNKFEIITLHEAGIDIDIPEPYDTLEENASKKSKTIYQLTHINCFSEDTGLEMETLNGEPGVKSARYAGDHKSFNANIEKLLTNLADKPNRNARFRTVLSLIIDGEETLFEGICKGKIIDHKKGNEGFGYDPIFIPEGAIKTFAEMDTEEKNKYSHRTRAAAKLVAFLTNSEIKSKT